VDLKISILSFDFFKKGFYIFFQGMLRVYRVLENAQSIENSLIFKNILKMEREECLLRIYIIRGIDLQSKDSNGKVNKFC
jgi:hypothetical protein